ncbi:MAG: peptide-methionine (S)-S-oxide reductase MsrA [Patescibacteria group bacterium]
MENNPSESQVAIFGGGCFWCTEATFTRLKGVSKVEPGYAGGTTPNPTYESVCSGETGHVEVIRIEYDPSQISYDTLLTVFFGSHDATQVNRQGNDVGTQYRSVVFYTTDEQKKVAEAFIAELNASAKEGAPIATDVEPLGVLPAGGFHLAEEYHKDYFARNPSQSYCALVIAPKLEKVQHKFAELLKSEFKGA